MNRKVIWFAVAVFFVIIASRLLVVGDVQMDHDEVRSISRTFGSPIQIINWQPIDWPPLYYLILGAYRVLVGFHPFIVRIFSILWFSVSVAGVYRLSKVMNHNNKAALFSIATYATLGLIIFQSTHVRGYIMAMALFPLTFAWVVQLFECDKPQWTNAIPLGLALAALFYTTYSSVPAMIFMGAYALIAYPIARTLRWWRPAIIAIPIAIPQFIRLANHIIPTILAREANQITEQPFMLDPYPQYQWQLIRSYAGATLPLWIGLAVVTLALLFFRERPINRTSVSLVIVTIAGMIFAAAVMPFFGLASPHYSWWAVLPLVILVGRALAYLPNIAWQMSLVTLLIVPYFRLPVDNLDMRYGNQFNTPFESTFEWLQQTMNPSDVIFIDPKCHELEDKCGRAEEWDYYQMVYFPDRRLRIVDDIAETHSARRVWYLHIAGWHDENLQAQIEEGRLGSQFFGPWDFLWQLYEAPPDREGILYENGMRFHGYEIIDPRLSNGSVEGAVVRREGETVILRLWWSTDETLTADYSISTVIAPAIDAPALAQWDSPPQIINLHPMDTTSTPTQTSQWIPDSLYVEERIVQLPTDIDSALQENPLGIYLTVYQSWDGMTISADGVHETGRRHLRDMFVLAY